MSTKGRGSAKSKQKPKGAGLAAVAANNKQKSGMKYP